MLPNFPDPAAILELFLNRKRGNAGSLCIKHGTLSIVSHYITLHHIVSVNSVSGMITCCKKTKRPRHAISVARSNSKYSWNFSEMFTKSSRIENWRSEVVGNRRKLSECTEIPNKYKETFKKGIFFCIFWFMLTIFNNGQVNRIENW